MIESTLQLHFSIPWGDIDSYELFLELMKGFRLHIRSFYVQSMTGVYDIKLIFKVTGEIDIYQTDEVIITQIRETILSKFFPDYNYTIESMEWRKL